jgi:hypothetical protein
MTATNGTKSPSAKSTKTVINSTQAKPITKSVTSISNSRRRGPSPAVNGHRDLDKLKSRTASPSDNGHTRGVNRSVVDPAEVTVGVGMDDDSSDPSSDDESDSQSDNGSDNESDDESDKPDDESDTDSDGQSNDGAGSDDESADDFFDSTAVTPSEEACSKFIQKYTENCSQVKVIQNWRAFDRERGRIMAKAVLRNLRSGLSEGISDCHRRNEIKGRYIGKKKNDLFEASFGKKHLWPGDLPEYRHENMKQEFINWMKIFGWEVKDASFRLEGNDCISLHWEIKVPKYLENNN